MAPNDKRAIVWSAVLLLLTIWLMLMIPGVDLASPPIAAEAHAEDIAPRLNVPVGQLRKEIALVLADQEHDRLVLVLMAFLVLAAAQAVRLILEIRAARRRSVNGRQDAGGTS